MSSADRKGERILKSLDPKKYLVISLKTVIIAVSVFLALFPVVWMVFLSFLPDLRTPKFPPPVGASDFSVRNYTSLLFLGKDVGALEGLGSISQYPVLRIILNSGIVALSSTALTIFLGLNAAYAFHRFDFWGKRLLYTSIIIGRMFPLISLIVPFYLLFAQLRMINKIPSLIIVHTIIFLPLFIWFCRGYMQSIPAAMIDSGKVDGASEVRILWGLVAPVVLPAIFGMGILIFIFSWGEYFFASALLWDNYSITFPLLLQLALTSFTGSTFFWSAIMALGVVGAIVPLVVGIVFQKQIISGLTAGVGKF